MAFGVPPMLMGIPGDATYANYAEAHRAFYRLTVLPLATRVAASVAWWLSEHLGAEIDLKPDPDQIPALAERGLARLQRFFAALDERLADREFIAGNSFSIVDITAAVAIDFSRVVKVKPGEAHPQLLRWRAALATRPSMSL